MSKVGGYQLQREIGRGGTGIVYQAYDERAQSNIAIKLLMGSLQQQTSMVDLFEESARAQQSLVHENIAPVLAVKREKGMSFVVQQYYEKGALHRWLRQIDLDHVAWIFHRICAAVQYAHEHGLIHGDLKPSNVLIESDGNPLLTDFISLTALSKDSLLGIRWGTSVYLAPEVLEMGRLPDERSDIYALGLLLFEAVKGFLPRQENSRVALADRIQVELPLRLDTQYDWINQVVYRATQANPAQRFSSVKEVIASLVDSKSQREWPAEVPAHVYAWLDFDDGRPRKDLGASIYSIGSGPHCHIVVRNVGVAKTDAEIEYRDGTFLLRRLDENAAVFLNQEPVRIARILHKGDQIRVSGVQMDFVSSLKVDTRQLVQIEPLPLATLIRVDDPRDEANVEVFDTPVPLSDDCQVVIKPVAHSVHLIAPEESTDLKVNDLPVHRTDTTLVNGDTIRWGTSQWRVEYAYPLWIESIDRELLAHGELSEQHLSGIPAPCRLLAMRQYMNERPCLDISFIEDMKLLRFNDIPRVRLFRQLWADCEMSVSNRFGLEVKGELIELIKEKLTLGKPDQKEIAGHLGRSYGSLMSYTLSIVPLIQDLNLPTRIPIVVANPALFSSNDDLPDLLQRALRLAESLPRLAVVILLNEDARPTMVDSVRRVCSVHAIDVVVLGREDVQGIIFARDPRRTFRSRLLSNMNLLVLSPFVISGPAPRHIFFGRELEVRRIISHIGRSSFAVVAGRRFGKTSLLHRLHCDHLPSEGFRSVYQDCSPLCTPTDLFSCVVPNQIQATSRGQMVTLGDLLEPLTSDTPLILLLDEVDRVIPLDRRDKWLLFSRLRALASSGCLQVVLGGSRELMLAVQDSTSPLFNFANVVHLGPLDLRAVGELVTRPLKQLEIELVDEKSIVEHVWAYTSGHPNVVQCLCHRLIERISAQGRRQVSSLDVQAVVADRGYQVDNFLNVFWEMASVLEKIVSLLMADDAQLRTLGKIQEAIAKRCGLSPGPRKVLTALHQLVVLRCILRQVASGYEFAAEAFPRVIASCVTVDEQLSALTEDYRVETNEDRRV